MTDLIPPTPTVEHLTTIFRRITKGDIRIPAFQRRLVWDESQVVALLESVYRGFPIGSILLWSVRSQVLRDAVFDFPIFPATPPVFPTNYILDGMQRLSSLYGVFEYNEATSDPRLNMWFDLATGKFLHRDTIDLSTAKYSIPVRSLLNPRELFEIQNRLLRNEDDAPYVDTMIELQSRFQEYMIPIVTISREDVAGVVEIFERINNSGTSLDTVDFMRAVTWSNEFDLNGRLDDINATLDDINFAVGEQTLIKLIGLELGKEPLPDALLTLRDEGAKELNAAAERVLDGVQRVADFLRARLNVYGSEFVPYEGQLLVVYKALTATRDVDVDALVRWYWAVGFNESLRGKPDHYVARAVRSIPDLLAGRVRGVEPRLELRAVDLVERRFIQGRALSVTVAGLFASNPPRGLTTGELIEPASFMYDPSPASFQHILSLEEVEEATAQNVTSAKVFANLYVPTLGERLVFADDGYAKRALMDAPPDPEVLKSQFLSVEALDRLRAGDFSDFLAKRAEIMVGAASWLVNGYEVAVDLGQPPAQPPQDLKLSKDAVELLSDAVRDKSGAIMRLQFIGGTSVRTNNREFIDANDPRTEARWRGAVDELAALKLVEDRAGKGEVFFVTHRGYQTLDQVGGRS